MEALKDGFHIRIGRESDAKMLQLRWGGDKPVHLEGHYIDNPDNPIRCKEFMREGSFDWDVRRVQNVFLSEDAKQQFSFLMVLLWNIWNRRNRWLHSNQLVPARLVSEYAQIVHGGFQQNNEDVVSQVACVGKKNWSKPEQGHIKINVDGAWKASTRTAAIGRTSNPPGMVGRRARKSMSGAANDSTTKFPISGKVPLEWLMHRLASPNPGHAQSVGVFVTPGRPTTRGFGLVDARSRWLCATCLDNVTPNTGSPCVATVQLGGVSRPSNVRASARLMSQWDDKGDVSAETTGPAPAEVSAGIQISAERLLCYWLIPKSE
ncbi:hypothetical protein V6N13_116720 [Hibiscus sabdariffa]